MKQSACHGGYLTTAFGQDHVRQTCVILTRACISSPFESKLRHCPLAGETSAARMQRVTGMSIRMTKETTPLWVWLSLALFAIGALAYVTAVYLTEYVLGLL